jgi:hypothetical protein
MTDDKKVVELRPELAILKEAQLELRRSQHKHMFQELVVSAIRNASIEYLKYFDSHILDHYDRLAEMILDKTEEIGKR